VRIGLLTDGYRPGTNGVIHFVSLHKRTLESLGHQAFVFTWGEKDPDDETGVVRSPGLRFIKPGYHVALGYSRQALRVLQTVDVLHANQPVLSGALALRYSRRYGIPTVLSCHSRYDLLGVTILPFLPLSLYRAVLRAYLRRSSPGYDVVTAPSTEAAQVMRDLGLDGPIEVIPSGIELDRYRRPKGELRREELGLPQDGSVAIFVGRLAPEKNVSFLLEALARPELAHAYLLIVGDGSRRPHLEALAQELGVTPRVRFVGEIAHDSLPPYVALADLFVTASKIEMLPLSVMEAMATGLPIVGVDVPWIRHLVEPGINGLLADPEVETLARTWSRAADDDVLRARLARGARASSEQYSVRRTTERMAALYQRLIEDGSAGSK
jgi:glycosyltransferase involved in cell wall biosynthesis